ncbi:dipeptide ABC transporter ATP-binding protein [Luteimicrobium subarcticum]|uniref:Peptide/nickel transport system ATP-binding protein n=1 Tax=Luteimicrobium subarcticum TaxID=620910 RepID=A0A2M8WSA5_9MICO|nr:ABC transporter ATP-binding protein [Luteimicrobium subarcticum]PJI93827.1 peptide/nickel transport system ATP-binding protein [Luteimicrobium subarcticum]
MTAPLLAVDGLHVTYSSPRGDVPAVRGVALTVAAGETVALVGESGSGKSTTAHAVVRLLAPGARITGGTVTFQGTDLTRAPARVLRSVRGVGIGLVPQDPTVSLNPVHRVGRQVAEVLRIHGLADRVSAAAAADEALRAAGLPDGVADQYPHELSGGMRQRALIAVALAARPALLIADEPTSALDVTVQRRILDRLDDLTASSGTGVLLVTHDLGVAAERADRIVVMSQGQVVEAGTPDEILGAPRDPYTRALLDAAPSLTHRRAGRPAGTRPAGAVTRDRTPSGPDRAGSGAVLELRGIVKEFPRPRSVGGGTFRAVDDVDLTLRRGSTLGVVGESGSGKSTTARVAVRLADATGGRVLLDGEDVTAARGGALRAVRRRVQLVHQNPYASLNPRLSVERIVTDPLRAFGIGDRRSRHARAVDLADRVALPSTVLGRRPAELSGGQRQRVAIARALAVDPDVVVLDEPVSALDVRVQAQVLELLTGLQADLGVSYLFITHDLAVVRQVAHDVAVMRNGRVVEHGPADQVLHHPQHPYTHELLEAIPGTRALAHP